MRWAGSVAAVVLLSAGIGAASAATDGSAIELSPDTRPVLLLTPPQGELQLVRRATHRRVRLPTDWQTTEPDRGFTQALLMQLSHVAANWPWRSLIISTSGQESDRQLQGLAGQDAVVAVAQDELVDLAGKVEFHVIVELTTLRAIATTHETRVHTHVEYIAPALVADSAQPRRNLASFAKDGPLDGQASTAATDISQFLATIVARVSVPSSLHPHTSTLRGLGLHPVCAECRGSDRVVYLQPGRVWVRVGKPPGSILALPLKKTLKGRIFTP
jgi:hypothetical protein